VKLNSLRELTKNHSYRACETRRAGLLLWKREGSRFSRERISCGVPPRSRSASPLLPGAGAGAKKKRKGRAEAVRLPRRSSRPRRPGRRRQPRPLLTSHCLLVLGKPEANPRSVCYHATTAHAHPASAGRGGRHGPASSSPSTITFRGTPPLTASQGNLAHEIGAKPVIGMVRALSTRSPPRKG